MKPTIYFKAYACADKHLQVKANDHICTQCGARVSPAVVKGYKWYNDWYRGYTCEEFERWL